MTALGPSSARLAHRRRRPSSPDSADRARRRLRRGIRSRGWTCTAIRASGVCMIISPSSATPALAGSRSRIRGRPGQVRWPCSSPGPGMSRIEVLHCPVLSAARRGAGNRPEGVTFAGPPRVLVGEAVRPSREVRAGTLGFRRLLRSTRRTERVWSHPPPDLPTRRRDEQMPTSHPPARTNPRRPVRSMRAHLPAVLRRSHLPADRNRQRLWPRPGEHHNLLVPSSATTDRTDIRRWTEKGMSHG